MMKQSMFITGAMFSLLTLSLFSCKKSDDTTPEVEPPVVSVGLLLDSTITVDENPLYDETVAFKYNNDSTLSAYIRYYKNSDLTQGNIFLYNEKKQITKHVFSYSDKVSDSTETEVWICDSKGRLVIKHPNNWNERDSIVYNDNNQPIRIFTYYAGEVYYADTLTWTGKNLTTYKSTQYLYGGNPGDEYIETFTFKYDDKKNPYAAAPAMAFHYRVFMCRLSENNVMEMVTTVKGGSTNTTTYTYTYNDKNYPTSEAYVLSGEGVSGSGTTTFVYKKK